MRQPSLFLRPFGSRLRSTIHPRLTPWATLLRRSAAHCCGVTWVFAGHPCQLSWSGSRIIADGRTLRQPSLFFRPFGTRIRSTIHPRLMPWATFLRRSAAHCCGVTWVFAGHPCQLSWSGSRIIADGRTLRQPSLFFRPFGSRIRSTIHPRLTPWAAFLRRSAAHCCGVTAVDFMPDFGVVTSGQPTAGPFPGPRSRRRAYE
jgi:hypothetical protein